MLDDGITTEMLQRKPMSGCPLSTWTKVSLYISPEEIYKLIYVQVLSSARISRPLRITPALPKC